MQNKMVRFILKLDSRAHIGNDELVNAGFLSVVDRVKQLKLGHVFKIKYLNYIFFIFRPQIFLFSTFLDYFIPFFVLI